MGLREPFSSSTHFFAAIWAAYATLVLVRLTRGGKVRKASVAIYGLSMVFLYGASAAYHGLRYDDHAEKRFFQRLDQSGIYILIAGTCTPPIAMLLAGRLRVWIFGLIWGTAAAAVACLWLWPEAPYSVVVWSCLAIGWLSVGPVWHYYRAVGWRAMNLVWLGSGSYTLGTLCELLEWPNPWWPWFGYHEIFHLCDIVGSLAFFTFIVRHVIPHRRVGGGRAAACLASEAVAADTSAAPRTPQVRDAIR